jgi:hypothetical protein
MSSTVVYEGDLEQIAKAIEIVEESNPLTNAQVKDALAKAKQCSEAAQDFEKKFKAEKARSEQLRQRLGRIGRTLDIVASTRGYPTGD